MSDMFCYQCEQTARGIGCTTAGVCGKNSVTAAAQDTLTAEMISLARVGRSEAHIDLIVDGLFATVTNVSFDPDVIADLTGRVRAAIQAAPPEAPAFESLAPEELFRGDEDPVSLRSTLLFGLRGMAAYAHHARVLGKRSGEVDGWFLKGMAALAEEHTAEEWLDLLMEFGRTNLACMALLDAANTGAYGEPVPVPVPLAIESGPFIVVSGHDLRDLKMLLEQTDGRGVHVYTHGEMLPAHAYPELKKHPQLKGNFGTAWQSQQKELADIPAPVLFTTNCLMPPRPSYADRIYTTSVVAYPGMRHIPADADGHKDFSALIDHALDLGGYPQTMARTGINGGSSVTTGFGRHAVLSNAHAIIDAVKSGAIRHFFLVGGCDGAKPGRNYYTEFVKRTPSDTIILTLACGKYRFNDLDLGTAGGFPRILDMGQCNDAYGAIQVASALAEAFGCGINELPLTLVLSWYEQKAVCILLTLLALGIRDIYIGPSIPAFFSDRVLELLVNRFNLHPITTPQRDMEDALSRASRDNTS